MEEANKKMSNEFQALSKALQMINDAVYTQQKKKKILGYRQDQEAQDKILSEKRALLNLIQQSDFTPKYKELLLASVKNLGEIETLPLGLETMPTLSSVPPVIATEPLPEFVEERKEEQEDAIPEEATFINDQYKDDETIDGVIFEIQTGNYELGTLRDIQEIFQRDAMFATDAQAIDNLDRLNEVVENQINELQQEQIQEGQRAFEGLTKPQLIAQLETYVKSGYYAQLNKDQLLQTLNYFIDNPDLNEAEKKDFIKQLNDAIKAQRLGQNIPEAPLGVGIEEKQGEQLELEAEPVLVGNGLSKKKKLKINLGSIKAGNDNKKLIKKTKNMLKKIK